MKDLSAKDNTKTVSILVYRDRSTSFLDIIIFLTFISLLLKCLMVNHRGIEQNCSGSRLTQYQGEKYLIVQ